ncbi:MAG: vitamin K epoxide reductase [Oscillochloris sp.]|nr:vitamin K epoxide reductase [Oscillochloris sp.]
MSDHHIRPLAPLIGLVALLLTLFSGGMAYAASPTVYAVLFYSPTCPHCHVVREQVLPPLKEQYGTQLHILEVDVTQEKGQELYQAMIAAFAITQDRLGVPALVVGQKVMVGSEEIPSQLPALIVTTLNAGGNDWPVIPGIDAWVSADASATASTPVPTSTLSPFQRDPVGNGLAVVLLLAMIVSVLVVLFTARPPFEQTLPLWRERAIPILAIAGLGVASYLAFVEMSGAQAVCGPVGDCNTVQQSPYARLFGVLPIGVLGILGYVAIIAAWALRRLGGTSASLTTNALPLMAFLGTIFSIYLTFLEPFVIGATCMWCLTSAVLITALLWITVPKHAQVVQRGKGRRVGAH